MIDGRKAATAVAAALILSSAVGYWVATGDQTRTSTRHLVVYFVAFAAYVAGARALREAHGRSLWIALGMAVMWRATLVSGPALLSDDVHRSLWEGRIQNHGGNPYAWPDRPDAPKWTPLRDAIWDRINHKNYAAIYPPAWQLAARGVDLVRPSVGAMKAFLVACELGALAFVSTSLGRRGLAQGRLLLWAWNPLALVEIAGSGHNEAFGLFWLTAALAALDTGRPWLSAVASAVGFQAKFVPGLVAAGWTRRYRPVQVVAAAAVATLFVLPFRSAGWQLLMSLRRYASDWRFNDSAYALLAAVLPSPRWAALASVASVGTLALGLAWRHVEPARSQLLVVAACLILSANVLPWYALWLLPSIVLLGSVVSVVFTGTVALAYTVYPGWLSGGPWQVGWEVRILEYGLPLVAGLLAARRT